MDRSAQTIDQVLDHLTDIIEQAKKDASRLGYFAALYRTVTLFVQQGIAEGDFDDGPRMTRMVVTFANRYLDAYEAHRSGQPPGQAWRFAFQVTDQWWPIVLQHLLLGMNAHINLDLGIAAARIAPGAALPPFQDDFRRINDVLASLVSQVQHKLEQIWPLLRWLDRYLGDPGRALINFSMAHARDAAWRLAQRLAPLAETQQAPLIAQRDEEVLTFARRVRYPGRLGGIVVKAIRVGEIGTVAEITEILAQVEVPFGLLKRSSPA